MVQRDFLGGSVVKTLCFHSRRSRSPGEGTKILHATAKKKKANKFYVRYI